MRSACPALRKAAGMFAETAGSLVVEDLCRGAIVASAFGEDKFVVRPRVRIERRRGVAVIR